MDSSRAEVCSGVVPCFCGREVRCSFSTCVRDQNRVANLEMPMMGLVMQGS